VSIKDRDKDKSSSNPKKQQQTDTARREAATAKRMVELMRQFGTILRQVTVLYITEFSFNALTIMM
jgi:hypothetical protein